MEDKILKVIKHYGLNHQQRKLKEEQFELDEAIIKLRTYDNVMKSLANNNAKEKLFKDNREYFTNCVKEELADNLFMLKQIQLYYEITDKEIEEVFIYKVDRQIERISKEML